jgi:hypothetical protein
MKKFAGFGFNNGIWNQAQKGFEGILFAFGFVRR